MKIKLALVLTIIIPFSIFAQPTTPNDAELAIQRFQVDEGLKVSLFAQEPLLANPVAFTIDNQNRFYVVETYRLNDGVTDTRQHMYWLDDDMALRTVQQRVEMYKKHHGDQFEETYIGHDDRVKLILDTDNDGKADKDFVFASGFTQAGVGLGAGVLKRGKDVWYACIPDLWLLHDRDNDGVSDQRRSLHTGYGVHVGYLGHDLHGLIFGPDGKLYFSIGDRGTNVKTKDRHIYLPDTGAVFRCEPDGSELEVFAYGLRNPQELAFDDFGNLFTGENNSDSGDKARWVYLVEGGDSGWRMGYQYITQPVSRGPWNVEKLWHPQFDGQAAYIIPPIANYADGPSGLAYYPGTGLGDKYKDLFFLCDFRGDFAHSGVRLISVTPKGASFEMQDRGQFIWSVLATDIEFAPDGSAYVSDWLQGWEKTDQGRLYKIAHPEHAQSKLVQETKRLLNEGFQKTEAPHLIQLLDHPDRRVRQEAQFELAQRSSSSVPLLIQAAQKQNPRMTRIHAIWALGQIGRKTSTILQPLIQLTEDEDIEVQAQLCRVFSDAKFKESASAVSKLLTSPNLRVRSLACISLSKIGDPSHIPAIFQVLKENSDKDPVVRHSAALALARIGDITAIAARAKDPHPSVRMGSLLAMRHMRSSFITLFLDDVKDEIVLEAARAIYDLPIPTAFEALTKIKNRTSLSRPLAQRILNAMHRLNKAKEIASFATRKDLDTATRIEAIELLKTWEAPQGRDRVVGAWRPLDNRSKEDSIQALQPVVAPLLSSGITELQTVTIQTIQTLALTDWLQPLSQLVSTEETPIAVRVESLRALSKLEAKNLAEIINKALNSNHLQLRVAALEQLGKLSPPQALQEIERTLNSRTTREKQMAFKVLGSLKAAKADEILENWLDRLKNGNVPPPLRLDLLESAKLRNSSSVAAKVEAYEDSKDPDDALSPYIELLAGGNRWNGRKVFFQNTQVYCVRCHKINKNGGDVGPDLSQVAKEKSRRYLLESIVFPDQDVAEGFESVQLIVRQGVVYNGVLKAEDESSVTIADNQAKLIKIQKDDILNRSRGISAMPQDLHTKISPSELRDLVEFLTTLK